jgi:hypothetical protein
MPHGALKVARAPTPSPQDAVPLPARVAVTPVATTITLSLCPPLSATYRTPEALMATPTGADSVAATPTPSTLEATPLPTRVVTTPPGLTALTL